MVIDHSQPALNGKIIIAEYIWSLHTEQQNHLRRPYTDPFQRAQFTDSVLIGHMLDRIKIKCAGVDFLGKIRDVLRLAKGHSHGLQLRNSRGKYGFGVYFAQGILHTLPDGRLRFGRDLLTDDMMHNRGEQVGIHRAVNVTDPVNDLAQPPVLLPQIGDLGFPIFKIHLRYLLILLSV